ncbi:ATP-binding cassette sub-family G member 1-like isoform X1 [Amblyomma americanum]
MERLQENGDFMKHEENEFVGLDILHNGTEALEPRVCPPVAVEWKDISFCVPVDKGKKKLLNRLYGRATPGSLTAIMGPSGAGKSTLLNILSGHYDKGFEGEVHVNGYVRDTKLFNMQSCYVMQEDCLLQYLTVREALTISIELRMPGLGREKAALLVAEAIALWGLDDCADTLTKSLSGGEKKRLAISQELVSNPPVLYLDEPTSGLDSSSALRCVRVLKSLAASGHTVVCAVHNPSAKLFSNFDNLYMLSEGKCIYNGSVKKLLPFLDSLNLHCPLYTSPSDFITEVASGEHGELTEKLSSIFIPEDGGAVNINVGSNSCELTPYGGRFMTEKDMNEEMLQYKSDMKYHWEFMTLLKRCFYCLSRNKICSSARIMVSFVFALLLTIMYFGCGGRATQVRDTVTLYVVAAFMMLLEFIGCTVLIFPLERNVVMREQRNCWYSPSSFYITRILAEVPFTVVIPIIKMVIIHWTTSQPMQFYRLATILLLSVQMCSASQSIGYFISATLDTEMAVIVGVSASAPAIMFCGFFVQTRFLHPAVAWFRSCTHSYYVVQVFIFALFGWDRGEIGCDERDGDTLCMPIDGDQVLEVMDAKNVDVFACSGIVLAIDLVLKLIAFALFKWKLSRKC